MRESITRRSFLREATALTAGLAISSQLSTFAVDEQAGFQSQWDNVPDRTWLGPEYRANPVQDWRVASGRIECIKAAPDRSVRLLTRQLGEAPGGDLRMSVRIGRAGGQSWGSGSGSAGFRLGIQGPLPDHQSSLSFDQGLDAGITAKGELFIGELGRAEQAQLEGTEQQQEIELRLTAEPADGGYKVTLSAHEPSTGRILGETVRDLLPAERFVGSLALVANFASDGGNPRNNQEKQAVAGIGEFWFAAWKVAGTKVVAHEKHAFRPTPLHRIGFCPYVLISCCTGFCSSGFRAASISASD